MSDLIELIDWLNYQQSVHSSKARLAERKKTKEIETAKANVYNFVLTYIANFNETKKKYLKKPLTKTDGFIKPKSPMDAELLEARGYRMRPDGTYFKPGS